MVPTKKESLTLLASNLDYDENDSGANSRRQKRPLRQSGADTDFMPRREISLTDQSASKYVLQDWGIEQHHHPIPAFPDSIQSVADSAFQAIVGTLTGKNCLDPNLASNAMARNTIVDYRPVRQEHDAGRLGIEIDGAILLKKDSTDEYPEPPSYYDSNGCALRQLMLVLAGKLSHHPWESLGTNTTRSESIKKTSAPPVAVYFNTVKQALEASRQLQILQHQDHKHGSLYGSITTHSLGQDDDLPATMRKARPKRDDKPGKGGRKKRTRKKDTMFHQVDPSRGVVIVVQPTDFNDEYRPPGPAIGILSSFQKLVARASAEAVPVVMVSPRFFEDAAGWAQGAGSQQAATYGGSEPPRGPTPWILRDFNPPVYCWVGKAVSLTAKDRFEQQRHHGQLKRPAADVQGGYSLIALTQSVMDEGHPWHVFVARHPKGLPRKGKLPFQYDYLASTKSSPGRPTKAILRRILGEFGS